LKRLLTALVVLITLGLGQSALASKAVNFVFNDTKGKTLRLSEMKGKWVLINFWAPWCPRCWMEFSTLNDLDARKDFVVIGMAMDYAGDENSVFNYMQRYSVRYPQVMGGDRHDPKSPALQVGPIDFYPTSYLYDPHGDLVMFIPGLVSKQKMLAFIDQYSQDNPASAVSAADPPPSIAPEPVKPAEFTSNKIDKEKSSSKNKKKMRM
jgi:thiol-disulfide isomerase/thioredoxin